MTQDSNLSTKFPLWVPRPVEETLEIYADWAAHYDADLAEAGYDTPHRIAAALKPYVQPSRPHIGFRLRNRPVWPRAPKCRIYQHRWFGHLSTDA